MEALDTKVHEKESNFAALGALSNDESSLQALLTKLQVYKFIVVFDSYILDNSGRLELMCIYAAVLLGSVC